MLGPLNYLFVHTFNSGKYCLGVFDNGRAGAVPRVQGARQVLVQLFEPFPRAALLKALTCLSVCCNCPQAHCLVALHFETSWCASTVPAAGLGLGQVSRLGMVWGCMRLVYAISSTARAGPVHMSAMGLQHMSTATHPAILPPYHLQHHAKSWERCSAHPAPSLLRRGLAI